MTQSLTELDNDALDALIERVTEAKEHELALSADDCQLLLNALMMLANLQENIASKDVTIHKLKKLVGIIKSSEKLGTLINQGSLAPKGKKAGQHKRTLSAKPATNKVKPKVRQHALTTLEKGALCPECNIGKLAKYEPASFLRITGQSPFVPEQNVMERLRCNACGAYFTAPLSEDVRADGEPQQKYGYSARSLMAINKYYAGTPFYRQASLQKILGVSITASTIFDQTEYVTNAIWPVFKQCLYIAGNAHHYYIDDTTHRILDQTAIIKKQRNSDKERIRTGVYSSGMIATTATGQKIVLFETNIGHAGEFIDSVLRLRDETSPPPIIMSDALASNRPSVNIEFISSLCNSHARRQFVDVLSHFPDEVANILERYGEIWHLDNQATEKQFNSEQRQAYHAEHSRPIMAEIRAWGRQHLHDGSVEENSGLGKAIRYFDKHYEGLTCFCTVPGAQLDNNLMEAELKLVVRDRKNAMFHKTLSGASIGDVITSIIATASWAGINIFDYLNTLQREQNAVKLTPENYLPWNYLENN